MRDYSSRLILISWQYLSADECQARAHADIHPDSRWCDMGTGPGDGEYFDPYEESFHDLAGSSDALLECLQIDVLRPQYDYRSLKYNSLLKLLLTAENPLRTALEARGVETEWSSIYTTTMNDTPVSAFRRSIILPNVGFNNIPIKQSPRPAELSCELIVQVEVDLEAYFEDRMRRKNYA